MSGRKLLNSVANDIAQSFESRNNDLGGFWALGQIFSYAIGHKCEQVVFDILNNHVSPEGVELQKVADNYSTILKRQLTARSLPESFIKSAEISVAFDTSASKTSSINVRFNENPFAVTVNIADDLGKTYSRSVTGSCYPHDPMRELQSTRVRNASN